MAWDHIVTKGHLLLALGDSVVTTASFTDVSSQVFACRLIAERDTVEIPATLGASKQNRAGGANYSLEVGYSSANNGTGVFSILESAFATGDGMVTFKARMTDDATSATNPEYHGTFIAIGNAIGGDAEALSQHSVTYPLKAAWVKATT